MLELRRLQVLRISIFLENFSTEVRKFSFNYSRWITFIDDFCNYETKVKVDLIGNSIKHQEKFQRWNKLSKAGSNFQLKSSTTLLWAWKASLLILTRVLKMRVHLEPSAQPRTIKRLFITALQEIRIVEDLKAHGLEILACHSKNHFFNAQRLCREFFMHKSFQFLILDFTYIHINFKVQIKSHDSWRNKILRIVRKNFFRNFFSICGAAPRGNKI